MQTSAEGRAMLKREEGEVLRAYRCPAGVWTIGVGLTAASGVVRPVAGMVITPAESDRLLARALAENYEPAVEVAMIDTSGSAVVRPPQQAFDAGVSFHFNTGAIGRASWVRRWWARDWPGLRVALMAWNKAAGRVLPALAARREREFALMRDGVYGIQAEMGEVRPAQPGDGLARIAAPVTEGEVLPLRDALAKLGYLAVGEPLTAAGVRKFQSAHGLTIDGIVGRATASAVQRVLDARAKGGLAAAVTAGTGAASTAALTAGAPDLTGIPGAEAFPALAAAVWGLRLAFTYRDAIAAAVHLQMPRAAAWLRSF